ncbi:MAG: hypothetical protein HY744_09780 [Deltaproteobacteria bacterium]|nr:hypothetical protein [Deltaproteobacteria bacterium]
MVKDRLSIAAAALAVALAAGGCTDDPLESGLDPNLREPEACVPAGTPCAVAFVYPLHWGDESVELRGDFGGQATWQAGSPLQIDGGQWRVELARPEGTAIQYKFLVNGASWVNDPANSQTEPDGKGSVNSVVTVRCERPVCATTPGAGGAGGGGGGGVGGGGGGAGGGPVVPPGAFDWRSAVLYFAFVDRFNNGDKSNDKAVSGVEVQANYQGGDFAGVLQKIEEGYFDKLGVNAIWLNVPIDNPNAKGLGTDGHMYSAYHGYWPSNLDAAEEHFGDLALIKKLVLTAHDRGIKILFDYAMNHMHEEAPIYAEHPEWFWPLDYNGKSCICGEGCDWNNEYEQKRCWFRDYLPDWNFTVDAARAYSVGNAIAWIKKTGCDGYRLDAVKHIEMQWITDLRQRVTAEIEKDTGQHFYMVGETFEAGNRDIIKKFIGSDLLDGQFDFPLRAVLAEVPTTSAA